MIPPANDRDPLLVHRMTRGEAERCARALEGGGYFNVRVVDRANGGYAVTGWTPARETGRGTWAPREVVVWSLDEARRAFE